MKFTNNWSFRNRRTIALKRSGMFKIIICTITLWFSLLPDSPVRSAESAVPSPAQAAQPDHKPGEVVIFNRTVLEFRAPFLGVPAAERAVRAQDVLGRLLAREGTGVVTYRPIPQGYSINLDGTPVLYLSPEDVDPVRQETLQQTAQRVAAALEQVVRETGESRNVAALLHSALRAGIATALLLCAVWIMRRVRSWIAARLLVLAHRYSEKLAVGGEQILHGDRVLYLVGRAVALLFWLVTALLTFNWIGYVLGQFPYTRPWGEGLTHYLVGGARDLGKTVLLAIPGIIVAAFVFVCARFFTNLLNSFFDRVEQGKYEIAGLDRDTVRPTRRIISVAVWGFALAMAYPYLPGSQTEAFKGLSLLFGLMVSLGGSSLVGQAASGMILMYTRTLRPGEYVQIASTEGTVVELGMFSTRIRTGLGEELTLPNSMIMGTVTRNYSRTVQGPGYILDATVTIGYDTPWRQVHAMLVEAARRTEGVLNDPVPHVFQTALSDFYPEYRLVCQAIPNEPRPRAEVMNVLHGNIQDVFNEYGVQIMSPHYRGDPAEAKVVPPEQWYPSPAEVPKKAVDKSAGSQYL
jgi:small-conductance mechanosensitive channel